MHATINPYTREHLEFMTLGLIVKLALNQKHSFRSGRHE